MVGVPDPIAIAKTCIAVAPPALLSTGSVTDDAWYAALSEEYGTVTVAGALVVTLELAAVGATVTCSVSVPGAALAGAVTVKCSVTVCPGAMVTGAGLLTVQPD